MVEALENVLVASFSFQQRMMMHLVDWSLAFGPPTYTGYIS
jgi:hypothetical protein